MSVPLLLVMTLLGGDPVTPLHRYNGVEQSVMIDVEVPAEADVARLVLLDARGATIAGPVTVIGGPHDLLGRMPTIVDLERAAWLQLLVDDVPHGSAVVVQPMRSRLVPQEERVMRGDGSTAYRRISGWVDEMEDEADPGEGTPQSLLSGWRLYPDREVLLETSAGYIRVALRPDAAPNTAWNFRELAEGGFYDGVVFHRVVPIGRNGHPFVIQGGDPSGTGSGGPGWWLPIERSTLPHDFGVISMARADDPDSAGSQFFFCLGREGTARLDGQYCAFGETVEGGETIRAIAAAPLANPATGRPIDPPVIHNAVLVEAPPRLLIAPPSLLSVQVVRSVDASPGAQHEERMSVVRDKLSCEQDGRLEASGARPLGEQCELSARKDRGRGVGETSGVRREDGDPGAGAVSH